MVLSFDVIMEQRVAIFGGFLLSCSSTLSTVVIWVMFGLIYRTFVTVRSGASGASGACWWQILASRNGGQESTCRVARYFQCQRRRNRRRKGHGNPSIIHPCDVPPPLPKHRRRIKNAERTSEASSPMPKVNANEKQATRQRCTKSPQKKTTDAGARVIHRTVQAVAIDLARMKRWSDLIERITCFRREARQIDSDGLMPLHWACSGGPTIEVIEALLKAYPRAAKRTDSGGSTALHFACHYGANAPVVQALLKSYPQAISKKDKYGRTPLYHAISKSSSVDVIRVLIEANPSMILEPCLSTKGTNTNERRQDDRPQNHRTPLYIAWSAISSSPRARRRRRNGKSWEKAHLLLEAAYLQVSTTMERKFLKKKLAYRALHATVQLDSYLPSHALHIALEQHSEQLLQFDEINGRCPLALAAISSSPRAPEIMKLFVQANSQAARAVDAGGQTALALALSSGKQWNDGGVEAVFNAAPDMLTRRDRKSCLYPALIAASHGSIKEPPENVPQVHKGATSSEGHQRNPPNATSTADKSLDWYNQFESENARNASPSARTEADSGAEEITLTTIYELIRAEPSLVKWQ